MDGGKCAWAGGSEGAPEEAAVRGRASRRQPAAKAGWGLVIRGGSGGGEEEEVRRWKARLGAWVGTVTVVWLRRKKDAELPRPEWQT